MTTIHTYKTAQGTSETRTSKTRAYVACLVAVITDKVRANWTTEKAEAEAKLASLQAELAALVTERGQTVEQATEQHKVELDNPLGDGKPYLHHVWDLRDEIATEQGYTAENRWRVSHELEAEAKARLAKRGTPDPWSKEGPWAIVLLSDQIKSTEYTIKHLIKKLDTEAVGHERVESWHLSMTNAQKALGTPAPAGQKAKPKRSRYGIPSRLSAVDHLRNEGYAVRIETSFEVRETKPRTKKAS